MRPWAVIACVGLLGAGVPCLWGQATNPPPGPATVVPAADLARAYAEAQDQLRAVHLALERNRQEAEAAAARNTEWFETRLRLMEQALVGERARALDTLERSQQWLLGFAGVFAAAAVVTLVLTAYLYWRAAERLAAARSAPPALWAQPGASLYGRLAGDEFTPPLGQAGNSAARLLGIIEKLEAQVRALERSGQLPSTGGQIAPPAESGQATPMRAEAERRGQVDLLLAKGQTLLEMDRPTEALACFDEALRLAPQHPEALLKKGAALEQVRQPDEALACYDRAIAADGSFTLAYLHKGGLCNRLARYDEALACYEAALRTHQKSGGS